MKLELPDVKVGDDICSFCFLVRQLDRLSRKDRLRYQTHLALAHGLKPYRIEP